MARVYDLEQLIEPTLLGCDKARISIESLCVCYDKLIVTTNESFGYSFQLEQGVKPQFILRNHLKLRKPISKLEAVDDRRAILLTADGQLWLLDIEKMELIKGKQSSLQYISDFSINRRPSSQTMGLDCELIISGQKKKSIALMNITIEDKFVPRKEYSVEEIPISVRALGEAGLIQSSSGYFIISFESSQSQMIIQKSEQTKLPLPMTSMTSFDQFLLTGPGCLGVFINGQGMPGCPPIQLNSNVQSVVEVDGYLATSDGEFVVIYGHAEGSKGNDPLEQLQIIPIPGIKSISHAESISFQICATSDAVYSLTKLPFHKIAFHLLSSGQVNEAIETAIEAEQNPPPGIDLTDLTLYLQRIRTSAAIMLLAREDFDKADATFIEAGAEWDAVLGLLMEKYSIFDSESEFQETLICPHQFDVDRKYTMQCQPQNVKTFILMKSLEKIQINPDPLYISVFVNLLISESATQTELFEKINELLEISLSRNTMKSLLAAVSTKKNDYPNTVAFLKWQLLEYESSFKIWSALSKSTLTDVTYANSATFCPLVLEKIEIDEKVQNLVLQNLHLFLVDRDWFVKIVSKMKINEKKMIGRLEHYPEIKLSYLEHLIDSNSKIDSVYMELVAIYLQKAEITKLRKFIEQNSNRIDHQATLEKIEAKIKVETDLGLEKNDILLILKGKAPDLF